MPTAFDTHLDAGNTALDRLENTAASIAFEAALAAAGAAHERALALVGLATLRFRNEEDARALELLDQGIALCLPPGGDAAPLDQQTAYALAQCWFEKASALLGLHDNDQALAALDASLSRFIDAASAAGPRDDLGQRLRRLLAFTQSFKISILNSSERPRDAIACCDDLIARFQDVDDPDVKRRVASAMLERGANLGYVNREDEEIAAYDALVARFGQEAALRIREYVFQALERKLRCYRNQEDFVSAVEVCDDIIRRFQSDPDDMISSGVARTLIRKAVALNKLKKTAAEIACYDQVVAAYGTRSTGWVRKHAAEALMFKAVTLSDADQTGAEMECYEEILRRYTEDAEDSIRVVAADALIYKGLSLGGLAEDAAEDTGIREIDAEIACYDQVIARYGEETSTRIQQAVAEAQIYKGETLAEAGHTEAAALCFDAIIDGYGGSDDKVLKTIVGDARKLRAEI